MATTAKDVILRLLKEREPGKSICPSEAAKALAQSKERSAWEPKMQTVRSAAARMAQAGEIIVTQRGHEVQIEQARGPVRLQSKPR